MSSCHSRRLVTMTPGPRTDDPWAEIVAVDPGGGGELVIGRVVGPKPDMATVDALARLQLAASRVGCAIRVRSLREELRGLLELAGLLRLLEPGGQSEQREPLRIEEALDGGDPIA